MGLTMSERKKLAVALQDAFPSRSALVEMVRHQLDVSLDEIAGPSSLPVTVFKLVSWAEAHGRTAELIRASQQWNLQNSAVQEFVGSLPKSTRQDEKTVPASSPKISASLRWALVRALMLIPEIDDFQVRSELPIGIPGQASLSRGWSNVRSDLETMVDQLGSLGQLSSGAWPLLILVDNARAYAKGTAAETPVARVYKRLGAFYEAK